MNRLFITGNATKDGELRTTQSGISVCTFTVAVNPKFKREGEEDNTQFFRVTAWRKLGENCGKYVKRGMKVCVVGSVSVSTYTGNDGNTRASLEVTADDVEFLTRVEGNNSPHEDYNNAPEVPQQQVSQGSFTDVTGDLDTDELPF